MTTHTLHFVGGPFDGLTESAGLPDPRPARIAKNQLIAPDCVRIHHYELLPQADRSLVAEYLRHETRDIKPIP